jgi:Ca-activated chloride channel family protein
MVRFVHGEYLNLLVLVPALAVLFWFAGRMRKRALERFVSLDMLGRLAENASSAKRVWKSVLLLVAVAFLVLGMANPQVGTRMEEVKQEGIDLFIALDVSMSMKAEDIKPNRLEKAKFEIRNLIQRLSGDRIGLIVFAGEAYTQFPLTTDYNAANLFLDVVDVDAVSVPGTSIASAIERAGESFDFEEETTKVLVIITDGESTDGNAFEAAEEAASQGVLLYTIGMGSTSGSPIPLYGRSGRQIDFKRDQMGKVVLSKLDEVSLEKIASLGDGTYYRGTNTQDELDEIFEELNSLQKREFGVKKFTDYEDRFQYLLLPALLLLVLEFLVSEKKLEWVRRWNPLRQEEVTYEER